MYNQAGKTDKMDLYAAASACPICMPGYMLLAPKQASLPHVLTMGFFCCL